MLNSEENAQSDLLVKQEALQKEIKSCETMEEEVLQMIRNNER